MTQVFGARRGSSLISWIVPMVLAVGCLLMGLAMRNDPDMAEVRRILVIAGVVSGLVAAGAYWFVRYRVVINDDGIRIRRGGISIDLGQPRKLRCGQFEQDTVVNVEHLVDVEVPGTHVWIAVEGTTGKKVLFTASRGIVHAKLDWPTALPPQTDHVLAADVVALRNAIGERITAG
jgi:hypothetical protein